MKLFQKINIRRFRPKTMILPCSYRCFFYANVPGNGACFINFEKGADSFQLALTTIV